MRIHESGELHSFCCCWRHADLLSLVDVFSPTAGVDLHPRYHL